MPFQPRGRSRARLFLRSRRGPKTRAQALVEFALIVPVFLFIVVVAIDFGRLFFSYVQINNAAREGAAFGASAPTNSAGIDQSVQAESNAQGQAGEGAITITSSCADSLGNPIACTAATGGAGPGNTITVSVGRPFSFFTPIINGVFSGGLRITASATATVLGYAPGTGASQPPGCSSPSAAFNIIVTAAQTIFADPTGSMPNSGVCNISGYNWTWGDGETTVGTATGDSHTYLNPGTYTVILEVTNQAGTASASHSVTVPEPAPTATPTATPGPTPTPGPTATPTPTPAPCAPPVANFTWSTTGNGSNKVYTYRDASTVADPTNCPITDWLWTFTSLGTQSNAQNPAPFSYGNNSNHPVTLRVTNAAGSNQITKNT
jgi:Flp pilus assembly protein TadG